jgi:hypothetical protein
MTDKTLSSTRRTSISKGARAGHDVVSRSRAECGVRYPLSDQLIATPTSRHARPSRPPVGIFYAGQRQLHRMTGGRAHVPAERPGDAEI